MHSVLKELPTKSMVIEVLVLNNCNLKDEGFAMIMEGLIHQDCLSSITYAKDEFGPRSMEQLEIIRNLEAQEKSARSISNIAFQEIKMSESIKTRFVYTVKNFAMLRKLKISGINLTDLRVFQGVYEIVKDS